MGKLPPFTPRVRTLIREATEIARQWGSHYVSGPHILLSFLRAEEREEERKIWSLQYANITYSKVAQQVPKEARCCTSLCMPLAAPFTVEAQEVLNSARKAARDLNYQHCDLQHILIGLMKAGCCATEILRKSAKGFNPELILRRTFVPPMPEKKEPLGAHIRWMIRRDMPEVMSIENMSFKHPWDDEDFVRWLQQRNCIGMVAESPQAEQESRVVGFMVYKLDRTVIHVLNLAVHPDYRRREVGCQMAAKLISKLGWNRRTLITIEVDESNVEAQLFFQNMGFEIVSLLKSFYKGGSNAFQMHYKLKTTSPRASAQECAV